MTWSATPRRTSWLFALAAAGLTAFAWWPPSPCGFVFDDTPLITENVVVRKGDVLAAATSRHTVMANRPLTRAVQTAQYALFEADARAFRCTSVALHFGNVLLLFAVVRAALRAPACRGRFDATRADGIAAATAGLWAVHPLAADSVAYVAQQSMLLQATWSLLALRCVQRADGAARRALWLAAATVSAALAMASKEEAAALPLLLVLYDRAFHAATWRAVPARAVWWTGLAWLALWWCIRGGPPNLTVGYDVAPATTAFEWLQTQASVVLHYLRLAVFPVGQRGYYDWPVVREPLSALLPGAIVLALLAGVGLAWRRQAPLGWLGALFFLGLAPTTSILPIVGEVVAERRMYLPMVAVLVPFVLALAAVARRIAGGRARLVGGVAMLLLLGVAGSAARHRVAAYRDNRSFWEESYARGSADHRSLQRAMLTTNLGMQLRELGEIERSDALLAEAAACEVVTPQQRTWYAQSLFERGDLDGAEQAVRSALQREPNAAHANALLASVLALAVAKSRQGAGAPAAEPRLAEAEAAARRAVAANPVRGPYTTVLAWIVDLQGRQAEAEELYRQAIRLAPGNHETIVNYADLLTRTGRTADAETLYRLALAARPEDVGLRVGLGEAMLRRQNHAVAVTLLEQALQLDPTHMRARKLLDQARQARGGR